MVSVKRQPSGFNDPAKEGVFVFVQDSHIRWLWAATGSLLEVEGPGHSFIFFFFFQNKTGQTDGPYLPVARTAKPMVRFCLP